MITDLGKLIGRYKADPGSVYNTWFINNEDRLKAFRSIRRGVGQVADDIRSGRFGNDFKGTSLESVLACITEQKQVFEGAAHPFYWKPKLRIPDIYENETNKKAFGQFLGNILKASAEDQVIKEIVRLDGLKIKGLGPAVATIIYFIHPTLFPPFNTAILNGFNRLFGDKKKLGSWTEYLKLREVLLDVNRRHAGLSPDLGAIAGLLFGIGTGELPPDGDACLPEEERKKLEALIVKRRSGILDERLEEDLHTEMQYHLLKIGAALGYDVICARNDRARTFGGTSLSSLGLPDFPVLAVDKETEGTVKLIDILWFRKGTGDVISAFEVEKSTSIYSGILRLTDLAFSMGSGERALYIVIPDDREKDVIAQLSRPSLRGMKTLINYIPFSDLRQHCDALCRFGESHHIMEKIARRV